MSNFTNESPHIWRLRVPFERIYTSVFLIKTEDGAFLVDCATTAQDVEDCIVPALCAQGLALTDLRALILTHAHGDHAGGLARVREHAPDIAVITDVQALTDTLFTYPLAGHTTDCIGVLDTRTGTLLSGDGLQGAGVDIYRCALQAPAAYRETLERVRADHRIQTILFSHAYEPWCKDRITGRAEIEACLCDCAAAIL